MGLSLACFASHRKVITKIYYMTVLTCFLFPSAGAYGKLIIALLLNILRQLAHARKALFWVKTRSAPGSVLEGVLPEFLRPLTFTGPNPTESVPTLLKQPISAPLALHDVIIH